MSNQTISRESDAVERAFDEKALTGREKDAVRSLLQGMTAQSAAKAMGVSPSSVGSYRGRAYEKLGVASGRELIVLLQARSESSSFKERLKDKGLSETQAGVCSLIAEGKTTSEIAADLGVAAGTVNSARAYGYQLLHIHSREELVELLKYDERGWGWRCPDWGKEKAPGACRRCRRSCRRHCACLVASGGVAIRCGRLGTLRCRCAAD